MASISVYLKVVSPGSDFAIEQGCTCYPELNGNGDGVGMSIDGETLFYINEDCPMHKHLILGCHFSNELDCMSVTTRSK